MSSKRSMCQGAGLGVGDQHVDDPEAVEPVEHRIARGDVEVEVVRGHLEALAVAPSRRAAGTAPRVTSAVPPPAVSRSSIRRSPSPGTRIWLATSTKMNTPTAIRAQRSIPESLGDGRRDA